jgi:undecaprenyl-diphosphatase
MADILFQLDKALYVFFNQTIANPVLDWTMPVLTDLNQNIYGRLLFAALWLLLVWRGGPKGRVIGVLLIILVAFSDQLSSSLIKNLVERPRPCHTIDGRTVVEHVRLLVDCGSGYSFPSSHAVNNFAVGTLLSYHYRRWTLLFMSLAALVGFSRVYVGVHFPSDVLGGAFIGVFCAWCVLLVHQWLSVRFPAIGIPREHPESKGGV